MPSSLMGVLARHSEHAVASDPWTELPILAEVLDTLLTCVTVAGTATGSARCRF
ncbi:hypothetical protein [Planomonospora algeriensis]